jgi:sugar phosphate isomerase/epimerase
MIRLSVSTLSCDGFADSDYERSFDWLPSLGIGTVELNIWHPRQMTQAFITNVHTRLADRHLVAGAVHGTGLSGDVEADVASKSSLLRIASDLGASLLVFSGCAGHTCSLESHAEVIRRLLPLAREMRISIALENHCDNRFETIDDYRKIFAAVDDERVGLCLDTGHFEAAGVSVGEVMDVFMSRIIHVHLKENGRFGMKDFTRFGEGTTDNIAVVRRLAETGYRGLFDIELSPEIGGCALGFEDLEHAVRMFRNLG